MDKHQIFSDNLKAIQRFRQQSMAEFANEIGIPKSTLQMVLAHGNTTLDTAIRIADGLKLPLDALLSDGFMSEKLDTAQHLLRGLDWYQALPAQEQDTVAAHIRGILEVIHK